jgi:HSP20 family molecular chaperone IbpA
MLAKKLSLLALPLITTLSLQAADPFNDPFFQDPFGDDIFKEMMQMQKNMDKMFDRMNHRIQQRSSGAVSPLGSYNMSIPRQFADKGDHYKMITNIPESKESHIDINTADGMMSITAKIIHENEKKTTGMVSRSKSVRMYQQAVPIPGDADETTIKTAYENGKLVISIKKKKGSTKSNTVLINGQEQQAKAQKNKTVQKALPTIRPELKKEFSKTVEKAEDKVNKIEDKEGNNTIKREKTDSDKHSVI